MLERVRVPEPQRRMRQYPHELSGGMRQRVMIGMSLLCEPSLLIADEPTTALDVTVQAHIIDLLRAMREELRMAVVLISHDFGRGRWIRGPHRCDVRRPGGRERQLPEYTAQCGASLYGRPAGMRSRP